MRFKLANVLLKVDDFLEDHPDLLYHATSTATYDGGSRSLAFSGRVDFLTYFNALSLAKWRKYTDIDNLHLHLELIGDPCRIGLMRTYQQAGEPRVETMADHLTKPPDGATPLSIDIDIDLDDAVLVGFLDHRVHHTAVQRTEDIAVGMVRAPLHAVRQLVEA